MKLFGGWLPFIGFREEPLDDGLRAYLELPEDMKTINTFQVGWLGVSLCIPLYPKDT